MGRCSIFSCRRKLPKFYFFTKKIAFNHGSLLLKQTWKNSQDTGNVKIMKQNGDEKSLSRSLEQISKYSLKTLPKSHV